jgi:choloylglycine hydrolase
MNWMQYILDNYSTTEEAVRCASDIEIDGWGWHFFVGDAQGNTAAIDFMNGNVVVHKGESMPIPGLFNTPYARELELLKYYKGFGGLYEPDLHDPEVPRFVKTAVMLRDYKPTQDIIDYGFKMLDTIMVYDVPEWSIIFDVRKRHVYFKTRINPEIKHFSMDELDFSHEGPVLILNMDIENGGNVLDRFHPYSNNKMREFTESFLFPILPDEFYTHGGITKDDYLERTSTHSDAATLDEKQFFKGVWKNKPDEAKDKKEVTVKLETKGDAVFGHISISGDTGQRYKTDHIQLIGNHLKFTYRTEKKTFVEVQASIDDEKMNATLYGNRYIYGNYLLFKQ